MTTMERRTYKPSIPTTTHGRAIVLFVLNKLHEEWDLRPDEQQVARNDKPVTIYVGGQKLENITRATEPEGTQISPPRLCDWYIESGFSIPQIDPILRRFVQSGLITEYEFVDLDVEWMYRGIELHTCLYIEFHPEFAKNFKAYETQLKKISHFSKVEQSKHESQSVETENKPKTVAEKNGLGYLVLHDQKIPIGESSSGKFRLLEILCGDGFGLAKTIDTVFSASESVKDKNKIDGDLSNPYMEKRRKLSLLSNQIKEVNRSIADHARTKKLKDLRYRLTLKHDNKTHPKQVWLIERVGRRG